MSALFNVCVPFEVVAILQRAEGVEQALQNLAISQDVPTRMVTDIARGVVAQVNAMPYSITLKSLNPSALAFAPATVQDPVGLGEDMPSATASPTMTDFLPEFRAATASPLTDPFVTGGKPTVLTPSTDTYVDKVNFTIHNPVTDNVITFRARTHVLFDKVATTYAARFDLLKSAFVFTFRNGVQLSLSDDPVSWSTPRRPDLAMLDITEGAVIIAKRLPFEINVTFRDRMMREETLTCMSTDSFIDVAHECAYRCGHRFGGNFTYGIPTSQGGIYHYDIDEDANGDNLEKLGIDDGAVITMKPKVDESYNITYTIRDAMNRGESFEMNSTTTVAELVASYIERTRYSTGALQFELDGVIFGSTDHGVGGVSIEVFGIYDHALIKVQPLEQMKGELGGWSNRTVPARYTSLDSAVLSQTSSPICKPGTPAFANKTSSPGGWGRSPSLAMRSPHSSRESDVTAYGNVIGGWD
ncbi:hypothetical protein LTR10_010011 [Elasticomyces elasticus]|nr:hypothetical protein LTR10_010011 [Elasticomyces elasticus]KAK4970303.1 hypothetical protein LTR42_008470 [Elasticomyces elasticus]